MSSQASLPGEHPLPSYSLHDAVAKADVKVHFDCSSSLPTAVKQHSMAGQQLSRVWHPALVASTACQPQEIQQWYSYCLCPQRAQLPWDVHLAHQ